MPTYQLKIDAEFLDYPGTPEEAAERFIYEIRKTLEYVIVMVEDEDEVTHEFHV